MSIGNYPKAPGATLDYTLDWGSWLESGETISSSAWAITDPVASMGGVTVFQSNVIGNTTTVWLQGGADGITYTVSNTVRTTSGRIDTRSITVKAGPR